MKSAALNPASAHAVVTALRVMGDDPGNAGVTIREAITEGFITAAHINQAKALLDSVLRP